MDDLTGYLLRWQRGAGYQLVLVEDVLILTGKAGTQRKVVATFSGDDLYYVNDIDRREKFMIPIWTCVDIEQGKTVNYSDVDLDDLKVMDRIDHGTYHANKV
jgi:hypothetical protein